MTMYRMQQRETDPRRWSTGTLRLRRVLLDLAARHREDVFAAHTHTQPAQPTTIAHYLLAVVEQLERDARPAARGVRQHEPESARRLRDHRHRVSDRSRRTTALLGFDAPTGNTYGSIATVDYLLESVSAPR